MGAFNEMKAFYVEYVLSYNVVKYWHHQFRRGRTLVESVPIPGRPQSAIDDATIQQVEAAILEERRVTVCQLAHEVNIIVGSVGQIIHGHLHMGEVSPRCMGESFQDYS